MKTWDIKRTIFTVSDFISWMGSGEVELSPSFQRRHVWKKPAKSLFIDTLVRGLPIPIIFVREKTDIESYKTIREIVDGQQRLRTVVSFVNPSLLQDFDDRKDNFHIMKSHNTDLASLPFDRFPSDFKRRILSYQFSVDVLPPDTDDAEALQIFARMNATGTKLNAQELRNAEYFGEFSNSVYDSALKELDRWRSWRIFGEDNIARMDEAELSSELYILMLNGITGKDNKTIDNYYKKFDDSFPQRTTIEYRFHETFDRIDEIIGKELRATVFRRRAMFYPLFAVFYDFMYGIGSNLDDARARSLPKSAKRALMDANDDIKAERVDEKVVEAIARRTTHRTNRLEIFNFLKARIS